MVRIRCIVAALLLVVAVAGCSAEKIAADPGFAGHWTSPEWGEHYIQVDGKTVKVIYAQRDGRVLGTLNGPTMDGWWTEAPTREPGGDAGVVQFTLTHTDTMRIINGTWRHGPDGALREDWHLVWVDDQIPADIAVQFDDGGFIPQPSHS